jgi:purine-binding chemotaxis protein CheW
MTTLDVESARILDARTEALARVPAADARRGDHVEVLRFVLAGEAFALPLTRVAAVDELVRITPIPFSPPSFLGLVAREGSVLPLFDLASVLGLPLVALPEYGRIVIVDDSGTDVAFVVHAVEATTFVDEADMRALPDTAPSELRGYARGVSAEGLVLLDIDALLASRALVVDVSGPRALARRSGRSAPSAPSDPSAPPPQPPDAGPTGSPRAPDRPGRK